MVSSHIFPIYNALDGISERGVHTLDCRLSANRSFFVSVTMQNVAFGSLSEFASESFVAYILMFPLSFFTLLKLTPSFYDIVYLANSSYNFVKKQDILLFFFHYKCSKNSSSFSAHFYFPKPLIISPCAKLVKIISRFPPGFSRLSLPLQISWQHSIPTPVQKWKSSRALPLLQINRYQSTCKRSYLHTGSWSWCNARSTWPLHLSKLYLST